MKEIPLTRGMVALVSDEDYERISPFKWSVLATRSPDRFYARRAYWQDGRFVNVPMHRFILDAPKGMQVDHINGDGLDNRRENLRLATPSQNMRNSRPYSATGFKGVTRIRRWYQAVIRPNSDSIYLGCYPTAEQAARIFDAAAYLIDAEFYFRNFDDLDPESLEIVDRILSGEKPSDFLPRNPIKLTDDDVIELRRRYAGGGVLLRDLAEEYGVSTGAVGHAIQGRTFSHITDPAPLKEDKRRRSAA